MVCALSSVHCYRDTNVIKPSRVTSSILVMPLEPIIHLCGLFLNGLLKIVDKEFYKTTHWHHLIHGCTEYMEICMHVIAAGDLCTSSSSGSNKLALVSLHKSKPSQKLGPECTHRKNFSYCAISMHFSRHSSNSVLSLLSALSQPPTLSVLMFRGNFDISLDHTIH